MKNEEKMETNLKKKLEVIDEDGLKIAYDKDDLERQFPQLMRELSNNKNSLKIKGIDYEIEQSEEKNKVVQTSNYCEDIFNPGAIDFIRRCKNREEALEILDYLLGRRKLNIQDYNSLKNRIKEDGGLEKFIAECGGLKTSGYYERKFPRKINLLNIDESKSENLD